MKRRVENCDAQGYASAMERPFMQMVGNPCLPPEMSSLK